MLVARARIFPLPSRRGFTLIEILVVMVIIGLLAGVALPQLHTLMQRREIAAQRENILVEISNLGYRAYLNGQAVVLDAGEQADKNPPLHLPPGWRIETARPIRYSFNGLCSGGKLVLHGPEAWREEFTLQPPVCKPVSSSRPT